MRSFVNRSILRFKIYNKLTGRLYTNNDLLDILWNNASLLSLLLTSSSNDNIVYEIVPYVFTNHIENAVEDIYVGDILVAYSLAGGDTFFKKHKFVVVPSNRDNMNSPFIMVDLDNNIEIDMFTYRNCMYITLPREIMFIHHKLGIKLFNLCHTSNFVYFINFKKISSVYCQDSPVKLKDYYNFNAKTQEML